MSNNEQQNAQARAAFEQIRKGVRLAPPPVFEDAPAWLHEIEEMREFFNSTASVWDSLFGAEQQDPLYEAVAAQIDLTDAEVRLLLLGCGTGLELPSIFARVPDAQVTGIDVAPNMLAELRRKFSEQSAQLELIEGSYLDIPLGEQRFDYVVATLTMHHIPPVSKVGLYRRICAALKPHGRYIEGDQSTDQAREKEILHWYDAYIAQLPGGAQAAWNYDVTLSPETQQMLLRKAGFNEVRLTWQSADREIVVFVAEH